MQVAANDNAAMHYVYLIGVATAILIGLYVIGFRALVIV